MNKLNTSVKVTELGDTAFRLVKAFKAVAAVQNDVFFLFPF